MPDISDSAISDDGFYLALEARFRGPATEIKRRLGVYRSFLEPLSEIVETRKALDLGCGRGEWLERLHEAGFDALGVDLDDGMIATARERGAVVEKRDALDYLQAAPDSGFAVVSAIHLVEHLPFPVLRRLVGEAYRALAEGGLLILETPNPENLRVGATSFYLDPTHQQPIPPALLHFVVEYEGFAPVKILRLHEDEDLRAAEGASLLQVLAGASPDYAIVAQKPSGSPPPPARSSPGNLWPKLSPPITA